MSDRIRDIKAEMFDIGRKLNDLEAERRKLAVELVSLEKVKNEGVKP